MRLPYRLILGGFLFGVFLQPALVSAQTAAIAESSSLQIPDTDEGLAGVGPLRRYDWFRNLWRQRRSTWATQVEQDQGAVVFLGDSITQGWGDDVGGSFSGMKVANRGISGDTTRGMLLRLQEDVLSLNPAAVVILMGTNDLEELATPEQVAENFSAIISALKAHRADMPIVVCEVFPSSESKKRSAENIKAVNALYRQAVHGDSQVTVVDTWTLFADAKGDAKEAEFPDLLHPNQIGYAKWAAALRPVLATLGLIETETVAFQPDSGFESLFNGHDLTGWCLLPTTQKQLKQRAGWKNSPPWPIVTERLDLSGETATPDGRYRAIHGRLVVTTPPEGRKIQQLWTTREFPEDFTLKLEFRATPNADSGVFVREPQLQCRDYLLAGPYKDLKNFREGEWNELVVVVRGNSAKCTCNGEVLEAEFKLPESGPIGLEGDRGQIEYRNLQIGPVE
ncbi:GDSL-type esterase/lipase family protein [Aureliella helgolandensis]|uniref:GDSL-like Lipase/Acylhydrolase n=1 Tax=Aureliella helgolandensis TaxID=2527968 RepID=A0A518G0G4_9BACT|nr:GDSL-type esterase/lipase family protein [Aureliella helgolandensis]QDV22014.1 GDSL-like Lipase/Acylhydrolase [Aureliella helgolandensis]